MTDVEIEYGAKILELKNIIEQLELLGIKCDKYISAIEEIQTKTSNEVNESHDKFSAFLPFLQDSLNIIYWNAIKDLDKINYSINSQYSNYYDLKLKYEELVKKINDVGFSNIKEIVDEIIILLKELKTSPTINYEKKIYIIEKVYELVYKTIKLEIVYTGDSCLLELVKANQVDASYVRELIKKEIKNINKNDEELASKIYNFINSNDFGTQSFLDKDLIALFNSGKNEIVKYQENNFLDSMGNYKNLFINFWKINLKNMLDKKAIFSLIKKNKNIFPLWLVTYNYGMLAAFLRQTYFCSPKEDLLNKFIEENIGLIAMPSESELLMLRSGLYDEDFFRDAFTNNSCLLVYWDNKSYEVYEIITGTKIPLFFSIEDENGFYAEKLDFFTEYCSSKFKINNKIYDAEKLPNNLYRYGYFGIFKGIFISWDCKYPVIKVDQLDLKQCQEDIDMLNLYLSIHSDLEEFEKKLELILNLSKSCKEKIKEKAISAIEERKKQHLSLRIHLCSPKKYDLNEERERIKNKMKKIKIKIK